jgi:hypothetical protein
MYATFQTLTQSETRSNVPAMPGRPARQTGVARRSPASVKYSFVVPLKDEEATIVELYERIAAEMQASDTFEIIFIDDGSGDGSWDVIQGLVKAHPTRVRGIRFRRNSGKAAALTAGFRAARGGVIFTLDADLQDDPKEIRRFLDKIAEGYDLVSGWKKVRHDPWHKVLPSRVFNRMLSRCSGVNLHDHNCGFKCYRAEVAKGMTLFGELHRMVPAIAAMNGFRVAEIVVDHHARKHGVSKYGFERYLRGFTDMLVMGFMRKYRDRPSHFIAGIAATCGIAAVAAIGAGIAMMVSGAGLPGVAAVTSGTVLLGTAILAAIGCLLAEITNRGGLRTTWKLPIIDDTSAAGDSAAALPSIQLAFTPAG